MPHPPKLTKISTKYNKLRQDSVIKTNNGQRAPKVRSKTVPEAHLEAQKGHEDLRVRFKISNIWAGWGPQKYFDKSKYLNLINQVEST